MPGSPKYFFNYGCHCQSGQTLCGHNKDSKTFAPGTAMRDNRAGESKCSSSSDFNFLSGQASAWLEQLNHNRERESEGGGGGENKVRRTRLREVGITQGSERDAMAVPNHPARGLLAMCSISTTAREWHSTSATTKQPSKTGINNLTDLLKIPFRVRAQGRDKFHDASIPWVRASTSQTWSWILCLRRNSMKGVLIRGAKDETGSQVSWDGP